MNESSNTSEKLDMNYAANAMFVMTLLILGYLAWGGLTYGTITAELFYARLGMMALVLSILYVGLQISRVAGKIGNI